MGFTLPCHRHPAMNHQTGVRDPTLQLGFAFRLRWAASAAAAGFDGKAPLGLGRVALIASGRIFRLDLFG